MPDIVAKKRFGQHFLTDQHLVQKMIDFLEPKPENTLIEIGPGPGVLTQAILSRAPKLYAIEIDHQMCEHLQEKFSKEQLQLLNQDVLTVELESLPLEKPFRVVGNLPYNISTPLIFKLLNAISCIHDMLFMLQKEVVDRLAANPGTKDFGRLSVMVQYFCEIKSLWTVKPGSFSPPPKVNSAVVYLRPRAFPLQCVDIKMLEAVVKQAFSQRRKTILNSMKGMADASVLEAVNIDLKSRAETLSVEDFVRLTNFLVEEKGASK